MQYINLLAMIGIMINDIVVVYSVIGSLMLFIGAFSKSSRNKFNQFADWSVLGLLVAGLSQIAMAITGTTPEKVGFIIGMSPWLVDGFLLLSLLLLAGSWQVKKNKSKGVVKRTSNPKKI